MKEFVIVTLMTCLLVAILYFLYVISRKIGLRILLSLAAAGVFVLWMSGSFGDFRLPEGFRWKDYWKDITGDRGFRVVLGIACGSLGFLWLAARHASSSYAPPTLVLGALLGVALIGPQFERQISRLSSLSTPVGELHFASAQGERDVDPDEPTTGTEWRTRAGPSAPRRFMEALAKDGAYYAMASRYYRASGNIVLTRGFDDKLKETILAQDFLSASFDPLLRCLNKAIDQGLSRSALDRILYRPTQGMVALAEYTGGAAGAESVAQRALLKMESAIRYINKDLDMRCRYSAYQVKRRDAIELLSNPNIATAAARMLILQERPDRAIRLIEGKTNQRESDIHILLALSNAERMIPAEYGKQIKTIRDIEERVAQEQERVEAISIDDAWPERNEQNIARVAYAVVVDGAPAKEPPRGAEWTKILLERKASLDRLRYILSARRMHLTARVIAREEDGGEEFLHELRGLIASLDNGDDEELQRLFEGNLTRVARHKDALAYAIVISELKEDTPDKERLGSQRDRLRDALKGLETGDDYDPRVVEVRQRLHRHIKLIGNVLEES